MFISRNCRWQIQLIFENLDKKLDLLLIKFSKETLPGVFDILKNMLNRTQKSPPPKLQLSHSLKLLRLTAKMIIWSLEDPIYAQ